jgi:hypothetical protein
MGINYYSNQEIGVSLAVKGTIYRTLSPVDRIFQALEPTCCRHWHGLSRGVRPELTAIALQEPRSQGTDALDEPGVYHGVSLN